MKKIIISFLLIISIITPVFAVDSFTYLYSSGDRINEFMGSTIPGAAIAVVDLQNGFAFSKGYGYADADKTIPVTDNTLFQTGGISASFTALAAVKMAREGKIDLDAKVSKYVTARIPSSPVTGGSLSDVTLRMLMERISGLPDYYLPDFYSFDRMDGTSFNNLPSGLNILNMSFKPYENVSDSQVAVALLGYILAKTAYPELPASNGFVKLTDGLLNELDMETSSFWINQNIEPLLSHAFDDNGEPLEKLPVASGLMPAASLWSSASEMRNYLYFLLDKGWYNGKQLLEPHIFASLFEADEDAIYYEEDNYYGLTWSIYDTPWGEMYRMEGGGDYPSALVVHPGQRVGIFVTCNGTAGANISELADELIEVLLRDKLDIAEWQAQAHINIIDKVWDSLTDYTGFYYGDFREPLEVTKEAGVLYIINPETDQVLAPEEDGRYIIDESGNWFSFKKHYESNRVYILKNGRVIARKMFKLTPSTNAESFYGIWEAKSGGQYLNLSTLTIEQDEQGIARMNGTPLNFLGVNIAYTYGFGQGSGLLLNRELDSVGVECIRYAGEIYYKQ